MIASKLLALGVYPAMTNSWPWLIWHLLPRTRSLAWPIPPPGGSEAAEMYHPCLRECAHLQAARRGAEEVAVGAGALAEGDGEGPRLHEPQPGALPAGGLREREAGRA